MLDPAQLPTNPITSTATNPGPDPSGLTNPSQGLTIPPLPKIKSNGEVTADPVDSSVNTNEAFTTIDALGNKPLLPEYKVLETAQTAEDLIAAAGFGENKKEESKPSRVVVPPTPALRYSQTPSALPPSASEDGEELETIKIDSEDGGDLASLADQLEQQVTAAPTVSAVVPEPSSINVTPTEPIAVTPVSSISVPPTIEAVPGPEKRQFGTSPNPLNEAVTTISAPELSKETVPVNEALQQVPIESTPTESDISADNNLIATVPVAAPITLPAQVTTPPVDLTVDTTADPDKPKENKQYQNFLDLLIDQKFITEQAGNKISVENISTGLSIEEIIERDKYLGITELIQAKAQFHQVPYVNLREVGIFPEALNKVPESVARRYSILPFAFEPEKNELSVAMINPLDLSAINFAEQKTGVNIKVFYAIPAEVERLIAEYYSHSLSSEVTAALEQTKQINEQRAPKRENATLSGETIRQAPITKIVQTIVSFAMKARASDIHIEPLEDRTRVRYRIDGILMEKLILPVSVHEAVVSRIKILSGLKIDEKRIPQDGRFNFHSDNEEVDLRVSTLPTVHGEKIVMRLLKKDAKVPELPQLGLNGLALKNLQDSMQVPHGIILVTGPTGSGKTTTLYSVLDKLNTPKVNIMTLEDPVEYQMVGVNQVQINPQAGLTFSSGLRSFLRQDPNIIMVGEIRDTETAELAVQASLTGHLVFSTLHTSSAAGALPRLLDMGAEPFLLASSMTLIMAQRVMRVLNEQYKEAYKPEQVVIDDIKKVLGPHFDMWCQKKGIKPDEIMLYRSKADRPHTEPEYKGRIAIFEVLRITEEIGKMILTRQSATDIEKEGQKNGMLLMKQDGYIKVLEGLSSLEEVLRVAQV